MSLQDIYDHYYIILLHIDNIKCYTAWYYQIEIIYI